MQRDVSYIVEVLCNNGSGRQQEVGMWKTTSNVDCSRCPIYIAVNLINVALSANSVCIAIRCITNTS